MNLHSIAHHVGGVRIVVGLVFACAETHYFGNNWTPQSRAEMVCDAVALVVTVCGAILRGASHQNLLP